MKIIKMAPSDGQNLTLHFFSGHVSTFRAEKTSNSRVFIVTSNAQTPFNQLKKQKWKNQENSFFVPQDDQNIDVMLAQGGRF